MAYSLAWAVGVASIYDRKRENYVSYASYVSYVSTVAGRVGRVGHVITCFHYYMRARDILPYPPFICPFCLFCHQSDGPPPTPPKGRGAGLVAEGSEGAVLFLFTTTIVLTFAYLSVRSKTLSFDNKNKIAFLFCIVLTFSYLCNRNP